MSLEQLEVQGMHPDVGGAALKHLAWSRNLLAESQAFWPLGSPKMTGLARSRPQGLGVGWTAELAWGRGEWLTASGLSGCGWGVVQHSWPYCQ